MNTNREDILGTEIVDCAFKVHKHLGPGLLEKIYETCFCHELSKKGIPFRQQVEIPIVYDTLTLEMGMRLDVLVDNLVICELKAVDALNPLFQAQLLSQLKLTGKQIGYLINFNVPVIKQGITRYKI